MSKDAANLIKTPYKNTAFTDEQLEEFLLCADPITGPQYFMDNFFYIQHPTRGKMLYHPFEYQKRLIDTYHENRFSISMMPRQTGKSTSAAGYLLWYAMFVPDSTILIAAHKYTGSQEIMQRIRYAYELCPDHIRAGVTSYNKGNLDFENGSRIVSATTTENTGRGMSISLLYADEFAFVRPGIAKEFWTSISPTLATGGKAIITSTPNSDEDQFALLWKGALKCEDEYGNPTPVGINGFKAYRSYWNEHPDRDEAWAVAQRAQLGEDRFRREMGCEFIINDETLIAPAKLIDLQGHEPLYKTGQVRWYQKPKEDRTYVVSLDPSLGTGGDAAAIQVFEANTTEQVAEWRHNRTPIPEQIRILADICAHINEVVNDVRSVYFSVENNTIGEAALISIAEYGEENIKGYFLSDPNTGGGRRYRKGFNTSNKPKLSACNKLKTLIESGKMKIRSPGLVSELKTFVASGAGFAAKPGETDDLVMATILNIRMLQLLQTYDTGIDNQMRDHGDVIIAPMPFISVMR
jgi:Terminase large subunit, T4likevirus-type, N-terminal/Terminase RNaseH-like domain